MHLNRHPASSRAIAGASCLVLGCLLTSLNAAPTKSTVSEKPQPRYQDAFFDVLGEYRSYYAGREPLCFTSIKAGSGDAFGMTMEFDSNWPGFSRVEVAEEGKDFRPLGANTLFLPFDANADVEQNRTVRVRPTFSSGGKDIVYTIHVNWMTRKAFAKAGGYRAVDIVKVTSEPPLSFGTNRPENWRTFKATEADIAFAQKQWGHLLKGVTSDFEKAKIITKALMRELGPHGGLPSAFLYELPTFEKYIAITTGKSKHACAQYSEIFSKICNCFGVINRFGFINDGTRTDEVLIELGSSHLNTEIFERELNQWIFIDGRYAALGAYISDIGPLTLHEFFLFMNQPNRRSKVKVLYYDVTQDREYLRPVDDCPKPFNSYLGWTKGFHTAYREGP